MTLVGASQIALSRVEQDGRKIPIYDVTPRTQFPMGNDILNDQRALVQLPEGLYWLNEVNGPKTATLFVDHVLLHRPVLNRSVGLDVSIWPGHVRLPQTEDKFRQRSLATFSSGNNIDGHSVNFRDDQMTLGYSLPYGYGEDQLIFKVSHVMGFETVTLLDGTKYALTSFFPLERR